MSDRDPDEPLIKNPLTRQRRAWIDHAVAAVRERLQESAVPAIADRPATRTTTRTTARNAARGAPYRPRLTVIPGGRSPEE